MQRQRAPFARLGLRTIRGLRRAVEKPYEGVAKVSEDIMCLKQYELPENPNAPWIEINRIVPDAIEAITIWLKERKRQRVKTCNVIRGGPNVFSLGDDLTSLSDSYYESLYELLWRIHVNDKITLSIMHGTTQMAGFGLACVHRQTATTEGTRILLPYAKYALSLSAGASYFIANARGPVATCLALGATDIDGVTAYYSNLADLYIPSDKANDLAQHIANTATNPSVYEMTIHQVAERPKQTEEYWNNRDQIAQLFRGETLEEAIYTAEEAQRSDIVDNLTRSSPFAVSVNLELVRRATNLTMKECMFLEMKVLSKMMKREEHKKAMENFRSYSDPGISWDPTAMPSVSQDEVLEIFEG